MCNILTLLLRPLTMSNQRLPTPNADSVMSCAGGNVPVGLMVGAVGGSPIEVGQRTLGSVLFSCPMSPDLAVSILTSCGIDSPMQAWVPPGFVNNSICGVRS